MNRTLAVIAAAIPLILAGCAQTMHGSPARVNLAALRESPQAFEGQTLVLGGTIVSARPGANATDLEVQAYPIGRDGRPELGSPSSGRFVARSAQPLDPAQYAAGRAITVVGRLTPMDQWAFGDDAVQFPVVAYDDLRLWPPGTTAGGVYVGPQYWVWPYTFWWGPPPFVPLVVVW